MQHEAYHVIWSLLALSTSQDTDLKIKIKISYYCMYATFTSSQEA